MSSSLSPSLPAQPDPRGDSRFLYELRQAVTGHYEPQITLACQVGVLSAMGYKRSEIQAHTGASPAALRKAIDVLRSSTPTAFDVT